ncbi:multidrug ABC transporter ATP-binding protein [Actinomycetes bacterium]|nr:multidrug ABC transporter ATP-binding protein [Actinomycetes bacterium]
MFQAVQSLAGLYLPTLNARIIDRGITQGDTNFIWRVGGLMLLTTLVQVLLSIAAIYFGSRASMAFGRDTRSALFHQVNSFSSREVAHFGAPSLITRITNDVQQVQMLVLTTCTLLLAAPFTAIGGLVLALQQDVNLSWIIVIAIPLVMSILGTVVYKMVPTFRVMQVRIDRINEILREQLSGIRVVRAFVREPQEKVRFQQANQDVAQTALRGGRLMSLMFPTATFIVNVSCVAVVWFGSNRIAAGQMKLGPMVAFLTYLAQILMSVMMATFMAAIWPRAAVSAERIQEVLSTTSSVPIPTHPTPITQTRVDLELRNVDFEYPGAASPVLHNISFKVSAGETLAIIGSTGSGKTTLLNLVARLFDATSGAVLIDGVDITEVAPAELWSRIGLVPQKPYLFSGTVSSNLRYGKQDATEQEMWNALTIAQADSFVREMPGALEAVIAQGGTNVSGGQRQRLAIARALIRQPEIYLFDDSFSALDLSTDAKLRAALTPHLKDSVTLIVGQRVSTIRHANQILVLEDGLVVGLGNHEELRQSCPTYEEIVLSQALQEGDDL